MGLRYHGNGVDAPATIMPILSLALPRPCPSRVNQVSLHCKTVLDCVRGCGERVLVSQAQDGDVLERDGFGCLVSARGIRLPWLRSTMLALGSGIGQFTPLMEIGWLPLLRSQTETL